MKVALPDWRKLLRTARSRQDKAVLDRRHVYILPSRPGVLFGLIVIGMLVGSINYQLNLGFALTFWIAGLGVVAMLHTWRNLAYLAVSAGRVAPVFAGESASFTVNLSDRHRRARFAVAVQAGKAPPVLCDITANGSTRAEIALPALHRGWLDPGRFTISTEFPLGLLHAWGYAELDTACLVYPKPAPPGIPLPAPIPDARQHGQHATGGDEDFSGLREYRTGDSMRRIDWKASAREQGMYTKLFEGQGQFVLWLDFGHTPGRDTESKLSLLTRWVLDAHAGQQVWGLRLPGETLPPSSGEAHQQACLRALALFGLKDRQP